MPVLLLEPCRACCLIDVVYALFVRSLTYFNVAIKLVSDVKKVVGSSLEYNVTHILCI